MIATLFLAGNLFAQTVVLSESFEAYTVGNGLMTEAAAAGNDWWESWPQTPPATEPIISDDLASDGVKSARLFYGNDAVALLGEQSVGVYDLEFDILVPDGKNGYFNVLHHYAGSNSTWAMQVYLHMTNDGQNSTQAPGHGTVHAGSNGTCDLPCVYDEWMHFRVHVDTDNDVAQLYFNVVGQPEELYAEWQWSLDSFGENVTDRVLAAMDFFPPENAATSEYYLDNIAVTLQSNDEVLIFDPFEEYTVGNKIAAEAIAAGHDWWTTWSNAPGGAEDGIVADFDDTQCGHLTFGNDQVLLLGDEENGNYDLEFDILVPQGKHGYFNILHHFAGSNSTWAMQCYLHMTNDGQNSVHSDGHGTIHAGSNGTADVACVYDAWMHFRLNVDTDTDIARYYYTAPGEDEILVCEWQWSLDSFGNNQVGRTLGAMDFYPPDTDTNNSEFYLDNFSFKKIGGESAPELTIDPMEITEELGEDDMTTVPVTIDNSGNSIGDWAGWIDFGQGGEGTQTADLFYHNGEESQGIGSSDAYTREMGIRLPATAYAGAAMGMKIVSAQYLVGTQYQSADHNYIFRIYGQGLHNQPGELLAEKTVNSSAAGTWITATFDEPVYLTGQAMWATVQLEQVAGEYPLSMDGGEYGEEQDGNWLSTNGNSFSHCYSAGSFGGAWLITVNCEGELIPATWATMDKTEGAIMGGQSETITLTLNSIGLEMGTSYNANLIINTNDENLAHVEIPVTLDVTDGVEETVAQLASVYPNPATSMVTLEGENLNSVAIYNVAGQLIRVEKLGGMVNNINMDVEAGVYFFSIYDNNGRNSVQRVVIVK